uniref:Uncharacterized protein n=1 Tax=Arundo donax TaxID=35708 RepID=A0A0A8XW62_ARUDO
MTHSRNEFRQQILHDVVLSSTSLSRIVRLKTDLQKLVGQGCRNSSPAITKSQDTNPVPVPNVGKTDMTNHAACHHCAFAFSNFSFAISIFLSSAC